MPMTPKPSVVRTDAAGLAAFEGDALLVLEISKREIETGNIASALERLHAIAESRETALRYQECLVIQVVGYDTDPRELAEIPEVRAFFARLAKEWPHWMWFLHRRVGAIHLLSRPCKIHPTAQANLFTAFFLAPFAAASAVASIQSCANKGVKKPFRPRRTMALSSQQML